MSKSDMLQDDEFAAYQPPEWIAGAIESYREKHGLQPEEMKILDWGCGRGRAVLWLRQRGYRAYGLDIDANVIRNGSALLRAKGYEQSVLRELSAQNQSGFPEEYFHFIFSTTVLEHVKDIDAVAREIKKITQPTGVGYHLYPSLTLVEQHLFMPLVHWLPKNALRRFWIITCVLLGVEPHWKELDGCSYLQRANAYYSYSINKTYYRTFWKMRRLFEAQGFRVRFETIDTPKVRQHQIVGALADSPMFRPLVNFLLLTFYCQHAVLEREVE